MPTYGTDIFFAPLSMFNCTTRVKLYSASDSLRRSPSNISISSVGHILYNSGCCDPLSIFNCPLPTARRVCLTPIMSSSDSLHGIPLTEGKLTIKYHALQFVHLAPVDQVELFTFPSKSIDLIHLICMNSVAA